ncbi:MAG TPA: cytochrome c maturation protein CcmE [Sphingomonas sp.]|nr:cytochrome c maturation protein CcmE [Sphingomonas sp.]
MKAKNQRLVLGLLAVIAIVGAGLLAMSALKDKAAYFYTPSDLAKDHVQPGTALRLGGMVEKGSLKRLPDGVTISFVVADGGSSTPVRFSGIVPALFREGSGVVADGKLDQSGQFIAETILAKHDERYMPPQVAGAMHKSESLKK